MAAAPPIVEDVAFRQQGTGRGDDRDFRAEARGRDDQGAGRRDLGRHRVVPVPGRPDRDEDRPAVLRRRHVLVARKPNRAVFTLTAAPGAFSEMSTPAITGGRSVVVALTEAPRRAAASPDPRR